jgi:two-component system chemotaxis sensor kinase CheA
MSLDDDRYLRQLRATFRAEADEHLGAMSQALAAMERGEDGVVVERLFREAHSLKGAARSVNRIDIEQVCQAMERVLAALRRHERALSPPLFDALQAAVDGVSRLLRAPADDPVGAVALVRALDAAMAAPAAGALPPAAARAATTGDAVVAAVRTDTVRVATERLDALMTQAEELQAFKFSGEHLAAALRDMLDDVAAWRRQVGKSAAVARSLRRAAARGRSTRQLPQLLEANERDEAFARSLLERLMPLARAAEREQRGLGQRIDRLQADLHQMLMLPFATLLAPLPRLARELAQASGKEVEMSASGTSLEADRRVLEQLGTPLVHLVRNAIDHGLEPPRERIRAGKPARGRLTLAIAPREGRRVEMVLCDDGAGIDYPRVRARAEAMGLVAPESKVSDAQLGELVFASGLSTRPLVSDLSGHGLGLAIVREKVEALGGTVTLQAPRDGVGTCCRIEVPSTLTTERGLLVSCREQLFVIPSRHVERVARVPGAAIRRGGDGASVTVGHDAWLPLVELADVLQLPLPAWREPRALQPLVVACAGTDRMAFAVDDVIGEQEVLVKPLSPPLRRVRHVAGATVLGEGRVVLLLHVPDLMKGAMARPPGVTS